MFQTMGDGPVNTDNISPDRSRQASHRPVNLGVDVPLLLITATLVVFGLLMVFSASTDYALLVGNPTGYYFQRQLEVFVLGLAAIVALVFIDYHLVQKLAVPAMAVTILLLFVVLFINDERNGAVRTMLNGSIQPSELAKLIIIIYLAVWLYAKRERLAEISYGILPLAAILGLIGALIYMQPDISAVVTIAILGGLLFFLAGGDYHQIAYLILGAIVAGLFIVLFSHTAQARVFNWIPGLRDPLKAPYQVQRSVEAFVRGGWFGVGLGKASTKYNGLPVPPTDSIFAVVGEELGFIGAFILIVLYVLFMWRGLLIARRAPDELGSLLAIGLSLWIGLEAIINMAAMVGLLPFVGNALPFISAGGSSLFVSMAAVGMLLGISRRSIQIQENNGRSFDAVINLRWRDRRRRVSSPRSPRSARTWTK